MILTQSYISLEDRAVFYLKGLDSRAFLQRLLTNNVDYVSNHMSIYALMLTPQGKFLYDFFIVQHREGYLIECNKNLKDTIIKQLLLYKLRSNIDIVAVPGYYPYALFTEGFSLDGKGQTLPLPQGYIFNDPRHNAMGKRVLLTHKEWPLEHNLVPATLKDYHRLRYQFKLPQGHDDLISGESYPHDFAMDTWNAIDYQKGCYVGQEVVSRMHHKATLRKAVCAVASTHQEPLPSHGTPVQLSLGETIGIMCSSVEGTGLALLKKEYLAKPNFPILIGSVHASIQE
jgi:tRNA-modifying protein YgfZ